MLRSVSQTEMNPSWRQTIREGHEMRRGVCMLPCCSGQDAKLNVVIL